MTTNNPKSQLHKSQVKKFIEGQDGKYYMRTENGELFEVPQKTIEEFLPNEPNENIFSHIERFVNFFIDTSALSEMARDIGSILPSRVADFSEEPDITRETIWVPENQWEKLVEAKQQGLQGDIKAFNSAEGEKKQTTANNLWLSARNTQAVLREEEQRKGFLSEPQKKSLELANNTIASLLERMVPQNELAAWQALQSHNSGR
jgi:hypothetical protein